VFDFYFFEDLQIREAHHLLPVENKTPNMTNKHQILIRLPLPNLKQLNIILTPNMHYAVDFWSDYFGIEYGLATENLWEECCHLAKPSYRNL
jgi:hypothetical protein